MTLQLSPMAPPPTQSDIAVQLGDYAAFAGEPTVTNYGYPIGDVRRYGAIGDGVADDTVALNRAFSLAGRVAYLPRGTFKFTANLAAPTCAAIIGRGETSSTLKPSAAVTACLKFYNTGPNLLENFGVDGTNTNNAVGLQFGDDSGPGNWSGMVKKVRVTNFTGANGVGIWFADALKSTFEFVRAIGNTVGMKTQNVGGPYPTSAVFHRCEYTNSPSSCGLLIKDCYGLTFSNCLFESNAHEGVLIDTTGGRTVTDVLFINGCWFEDNYHLDPTHYQFRSTAPAGTARGVIRDAIFATTALTAKALLLDGASNAGWILDNVQPSNAIAGSIVASGGAYGEWRPGANIPSSVFNDGTKGFAGLWHSFTPVLIASVGGAGTTYTSQVGRVHVDRGKITVTGRIVVAAVTAPGGSLEIGGLPNLSSATLVGAVSIAAAGMDAAATTPYIAQVEANANAIVLYRVNAGGVVDVGGDIKAGSVVAFTAVYETA